MAMNIMGFIKTNKGLTFAYSIGVLAALFVIAQLLIASYTGIYKYPQMFLFLLSVIGFAYNIIVGMVFWDKYFDYSDSK